MTIHEQGKENARTIVMLHGLGMSWDMFGAAIEQLSASFHLIIPALPGHDLNSPHDFTSVEETARELENALAERNHTEIECLYGLSLGGGHCTAYAIPPAHFCPLCNH